MRFNQIDLNLLRVLNVLLLERSVTRAAERLSVTQQAVSNSLKKLREEFNDPVLVRVGHGMQLTPLAASLLEPLREAMLQLEGALSHRPCFSPATASRNFRMVIPHYHSFVLLPQALRILSREAPFVDLQVQAMSLNDMALLERGDIDLLTIEEGAQPIMSDANESKIHSQVLFEDDYVCLMDQAVAELAGELTIESYVELPHCVMRPSPEIRMQVEQRWEKLGFAPRVAAVAPGYAVIMFTLPGTGLVATVPRRVARVFSDSLGLQVHECPIALERQRGELRWHRRLDDDPAHSYLRSVFRRAVEQGSTDVRSLSDLTPRAKPA